MAESDSSDTLVDELVKLMPVIIRRAKPDQGVIADCPVGALTYSEIRIVVHLSIYGETGVSALADAIGIARPTVTEALDRLVIKAFVDRVPCPIDRRRVSIRLTPIAAEFAERIVGRWRDGFARSLSQLDVTERNAFHKGMVALAESMAEIAAEETTSRATQLTA